MDHGNYVVWKLCRVSFAIDSENFANQLRKIPHSTMSHELDKKITIKTMINLH